MMYFRRSSVRTVTSLSLSLLLLITLRVTWSTAQEDIDHRMLSEIETAGEVFLWNYICNILFGHLICVVFIIGCRRVLKCRPYFKTTRTGLFRVDMSKLTSKTRAQHSFLYHL